MPAAPLGAENPLPHLLAQHDAHAATALDPAIPEEIRRQIGYEAVERILQSGLVMDDLREGEASLTDLWFDLQERRIAAAEGVVVNEALRQRVRQTCPPPAHLEFRGQ